MKVIYGLIGLLMSGIGQLAQAQSTATTLVGAVERYAIAHDSLMRMVNRIHSDAEGRVNFFSARQGSMGGLHRQVMSYTGISTSLVKRQRIKHRFGIELEKLDYYDSSGRLVLSERYEEHQLTRLELTEYPITRRGAPVAKWLFVRGDYLMHVTQPSKDIASNNRSYFFSPRPAGAR